MAYRWIPLLGVLLLAACQQQEASAPPPEVVVDVATLETYQPRLAYAGRLHAVEDVAIRARVNGYLKERAFHEGDLVKAGDVLYRIDPAPFEAELASAHAALVRAQAGVDVARRNYERGRDLLPRGAISVSEMDRLEGAMVEAEANLESAEAQVESARVNLSYTRITAPLSGRVGASQASVGDLVGPDAGALTTLVSIDPIRAHFQVSESLFLAMDSRRREIEAVDPEIVREVEVELELSDGSRYPHRGVLDFISNRIDELTGTIATRASVPNPEERLRPGQYVRIHVFLPVQEEVVMIPQAALQADQQGDFVLVVDAGDQVRRRTVEQGPRVAGKVIIREGLDDGERVVVRGIQRVRPGQLVRAVMASNSQVAAD